MQKEFKEQCHRPHNFNDGNIESNLSWMSEIQDEFWVKTVLSAQMCANIVSSMSSQIKFM